jgi:hypothetical protein
MSLTAGFKDSSVPAVLTSVIEHGLAFRAFHAALAPASTAWPAINRAYFVPFRVVTPLVVREMFFQAGTTPGTTAYDLGIYDDAFNRIVSLGATSAVSTTDAVLPAGGGDVADTSLSPGRYYMAMSSAATTLTVRASVNANQFMRALGLQMMESAHPLPATATPISVGTSAFMPTIGLATVTNIL